MAVSQKIRTALQIVLIVTGGCGGDLFDPTGNDAYKYAVLTPQGYGNTTQTWPVLVFLHGAGGLPTNWVGNYANSNPQAFPFILVTPNSDGFQWEPTRLRNVLNEVKDRYRVDSKRVYVTGFSMGAHGAYDWAAREPSTIAAMVLVAGAGRPGEGCRIRTVPTWFIHNRNDPVVPTSETEATVQELTGCGGDFRVTINENPPYAGTHDAWTNAYAQAEVYEWLLAHAR